MNVVLYRHLAINKSYSVYDIYSKNRYTDKNNINNNKYINKHGKSEYYMNIIITRKCVCKTLCPQPHAWP